MKALFRVLFLTVCVLSLCLSVFATDSEMLLKDEYCYSEDDFSNPDDPALNGIFVTATPEDSVAVVMLGDRVIRPGDILPKNVLDDLRLLPCCTENCTAVLAYQPVFGTALGEPAELAVRIQSGKNETPKAIDQEFETYKNIANDGTLSGSDPENAALTYQLVEKPKRGTVKLEKDGTYLYTPDKNKVGEDSFTFTVTDEAGNVSSPATVKIRILKPTEAMTFSDMNGSRDCYEAMWLCQQGLSGGRSIAGNLCFCPNENVSRAEFLVMAMELKDIPVDAKLTISGFSDASCVPAWMQPYLAGAMQRGLISGEVREEGLMFRPNDPITGQEAAVLLQNLLRLPVSAAAVKTTDSSWAADSVQALNEAGIYFDSPENALTRVQAARLLWQVSRLK